MAQDLRDLFKEDRTLGAPRMKEGHETRFLKKLERELPVRKKRSTFSFIRIAASIAILVSIGLTSYMLMLPEKESTTVVGNDQENPKNAKKITLGDLSPDLKKLQDYYVANINLELLDLEVTGDNQLLLDDFMKRLAELDTEYNKLTEELNTIGPNDQTVTALINNLQLRLQLLYQLKDKLNELKESKDEQFKHQQA